MPSKLSFSDLKYDVQRTWVLVNDTLCPYTFWGRPQPRKPGTRLDFHLFFVLNFFFFFFFVAFRLNEEVQISSTM